MLLSIILVDFIVNGYVDVLRKIVRFFRVCIDKVNIKGSIWCIFFDVEI